MRVWLARSGRETLAFCLALVALFAVVTHCTGCAFLSAHGPALVDILADRTKCVLSKTSLPTEQAIAECAVEPDLIPKVLPLLGEARAEAAREAAGARADERAKLSAGLCSDAGAP